MSHFVVVYASREGQTQKVAHHVAKQIENLGHVARLINVEASDAETPIGAFDAAVVAGDLRSPERASALAEFVGARKTAFGAVPSALLTVSLAAGASDAASREAVRDDRETFEAACGWRPTRALAVGGAFHDRGHGAMVRAFRHIWMHLKGIVPDPSGHTELTDWAALEAFTRGFVEEVAATAPMARAAPPPPEAAPAPEAAAKPARKPRATKSAGKGGDRKAPAKRADGAKAKRPRKAPSQSDAKPGE